MPIPRLGPRLYDLLQEYVHKSYSDTVSEISSYLELNKEDVVVEIGCGTGMVGQKIAAMGYRYWGIEPDEERIARARENCPSGNIIVGRGESIDFSKLPEFKRAYIHGVLHHMNDEDSLATLTQLLDKPGMKLLIMEPYLPEVPWKKPFGYLLGKMDEGDFVRPLEDYKKLFGPWLVGVKLRSLMPRWPVPMAFFYLQAKT